MNSQNTISKGIDLFVTSIILKAQLVTGLYSENASDLTVTAVI